LNAHAADLNCDRRGFETEKTTHHPQFICAITAETAASALDVLAGL